MYSVIAVTTVFVVVLVLGSFGGIRLYMTELIAITQKALQSQSWKMKAQGAAAMATVAKEQTGSLVAPHLGMVLTALMQGLSGRTWAGKVTTDTTEEQKVILKLFFVFCLFQLCFVFLFVSGGAIESHWISRLQMQVRLLAERFFPPLTPFYLIDRTNSLIFVLDCF